MSLLRIDSSILGPYSASSELADLVLAEWSALRPDEPVVQRHLGSDPLPSDAWATAVGAGNVPEGERTEAQKAAVELARSLAAELREADAIVLAFPLYNYGVSQHVKTWIDLVLVENAGVEILKGKPVVLLTTRGGFYGEGAPKAGWDHNTAYLRRILADAWGAELTVVEREFTLVGVNPALDEFTETAAVLKKTAHEAAAAAGQVLGTR